MGQEISVEKENVPELLWCCIDMTWYPATEYKVFKCGHYFCRKCLDEWAAQEIFACPKCRLEERRCVADMDDLFSFKDIIYFEQPPDTTERLQIQSILHTQMLCRSRTVRYLKAVAQELTSIEFTGDVVKIGGAATGLVGTGMVITGTILSLTGIGAVAGVPLAISGAAVGGAGGLLVGGAAIADAVMKKDRLSGANKHLQADFFHSVQLRILIGRASQNAAYASSIGIPVADAFSIFSLLGRVAKVGTTTATAVTRSTAYGVVRGAGSAGLHIAGIVLSAALIPIDIAQMVVSSIKIHKRNKSGVIMDFEKLGFELETELWSLLKEKDYSIVESVHLDSDNLQHFMVVVGSADEMNYIIDNLSRPFLSAEAVERQFIVILDFLSVPIDRSSYERVFKFWSVEEFAANNLQLKESKLKWNT